MPKESENQLAGAIRALAKDSLTDEYEVRNIVTAIYELARSVQSLADSIHNLKSGDE